MNPILQFAKTAYIQSENLKPLLKEYANPDDFLSRLVKKGELIRLKNGFFLIASHVDQKPIPYEQIANLLYGPSYVSFEWALSFYGMIPEGVYVMTSACATKSKAFITPVGTFDYVYLSHFRYAIGFDQKENSAGRYLIATPEKALVDLIHQKSQRLEGKELLDDLIEARRMNEEQLKNLDKIRLRQIADQYGSRTVTNLINVLGML